jgi:hypothetical protein
MSYAPIELGRRWRFNQQMEATSIEEALRSREKEVMGGEQIKLEIFMPVIVKEKCKYFYNLISKRRLI